MNISYQKPSPASVNISCEAHGIYPQPRLVLYEGATKHSRSTVSDVTEEAVETEEGFSIYLQALVDDRTLKQQETIFECVLFIPQTEYQLL
ncbi:hypothetical protein SK128_014262 [Halocaridina rubra]|uniref:Uncharacterized protein n=1 Tax=Halocaridina rubra TaxID=373956 RepID=A0AAN8XG26_HALRR